MNTKINNTKKLKNLHIEGKLGIVAACTIILFCVLFYMLFKDTRVRDKKVGGDILTVGECVYSVNMLFGEDIIDVSKLDAGKSEAVADENGDLIPEYCSDGEDMGIHFTDEGCQKWIEYLKTHIK